MHIRWSCCFALFAALLLHPVHSLTADELPVISHKLELERFQGEWYVLANIPVRVPFFSDSDAYNYRQNFEMINPERILLHGSFLRADKNGKPRNFTFKGFLRDQTSNAEWKIQYLWPIYSTYKVIHLDSNYEKAIIGVPSRRWAWILSRAPQQSDEELTRLLEIAAEAGFNINKFRRVPLLEPIPGDHP
jgi:apolipoprotein D and lipocalin family protein